MIDEKKLLEDRPEYLNPNMTDEIKSAYNKGWNDCNKYWFNIIKRQPKIDRWIPINEDLPELDIEVLVTCKSHMTKYIYVDIDYRNKKNGKWSYFGEDVIAWKPLPENFKEK